MQLLKHTLLAFTAILSMSSCSKDELNENNNETINQGNDPNFKIVANTDTEFKGFNRKVEVFGISIYAVAKVEDSKLLHTANVLAQYLDNNEDGNVDNMKILEVMKAKKAYLFMWKSESDQGKVSFPNGVEGQDLGNDETVPTWHSNGHKGEFDATLEEVWHIITHVGYADAYPTVFGEKEGTELTNAMDIARGGKFASIPKPYPSGAWYSYDDATCEYDCQATEYIYWAMTSILGAQENRLSDINDEWKLNTKAKVESTNITIYKLLTNPLYTFPTKLPDGTYKR